MSAPATVLGDPADASLAGLPDGGSGPAVALGDAAAEAPAVRWLDRPPESASGTGTRLIAPAGDGLWRVAPWPAADALFDMPPAEGGAVVVTGAETHLRDEIASAAAARGLEPEVVERLDAGGLARAACVVVAESPGAALPARAFAVLAAGRLLLVPRLELSFGLEDGLDHLEFAGPDEAVTLLEAQSRNPAAFGRVLAWGRVKARARRASVAYGRLAEDLRLDGAAGPG